jgi:hypothetical protein
VPLRMMMVWPIHAMGYARPARHIKCPANGDLCQ